MSYTLNTYTKIRAKKNLVNRGICFTKGNEYELRKPVIALASIMDQMITNDQGQPHIIGVWWRNFELVKD